MSSENNPVDNVEQLTTEQLNGKVNGLMGHITGKNPDEVTEIINKQPENVQEAYKNRILSQYGIKEKEVETQGIFEAPVDDLIVTEPVDNPIEPLPADPVVKDPVNKKKEDPSVVNEDELYSNFIKKLEEENQLKSVKESQRKAEELLTDSFGENVNDFLQSREGKYLLNYVNGAVQSGESHFDATNDALEFLDSHQQEVVPNYLERKDVPLKEFGSSPADQINKELYEAQIKALRGND